jgi:hypothetical protein
MAQWGQGQWGIDQWGQSAVKISYPDACSRDVDKNTYVSGTAGLLQFTQSCNVTLSVNDQLLNEDIINTLYVRKHGMFLSPLGVGLDYYVFDPNDHHTISELSFHLVDGVNDAVDGITATGEVSAVTEGNTLVLKVGYINTKLGNHKQAMIPVQRHKVK